MTPSDTGFYDIHVFCCVNERRAGHPRGCCLEKGASDLRDYMKTRGKELKIKGLRVNQAGCLDRCAEKIVECNSHETHNIYSNLNDQQNLELIKSMKLNIILLLKLKKEN